MDILQCFKHEFAFLRSLLPHPLCTFELHLLGVALCDLGSELGKIFCILLHGCCQDCEVRQLVAQPYSTCIYKYKTATFPCNLVNFKDALLNHCALKTEQQVLA